MSGQLFIISGSSGVGKGTVIKDFLSKAQNIFLSVSSTTRSPRPNEIAGVTYHYISKEEFNNAIKNDEFLEWAEFGGNQYGTRKQTVLDTLNSGKNVLLEIEVQGAMQVKVKMPQAITIFIVPPSLDEIEKRLRGRGTETEDAIQKRLKAIEFELQESKKYDYIIVNDIVERASGEILEIYEKNKG